MEKKDYKEYSDELLVRMARDGDEKAEDFLLKKYKEKHLIFEKQEKQEEGFVFT